MSGGAALRTVGIEAGYEGSQVLFGIGVDVAPGEVVALLGRNGMGKSTTVAAIAGTLPTTTGTVTIHGTDVTRSSAASRFAAGLRVMRQDQPTFASLSVAENLALVGCTDIARASEAFAFLAGRARQAAGTLSGGEQKLLALARTAVAPGTCWVLDEPTEGLQAQMVDRCAQMITGAAASGIAVLLVEQHLQMALSVADRWFLLEKGRVVEGGTDMNDARRTMTERLVR